jgi:hypothetical protein
MNWIKSTFFDHIELALFDHEKCINQILLDYRDSFSKAKIIIGEKAYFLRKTKEQNIDVYDQEHHHIAGIKPMEGRSDKSILFVSGIELYLSFRNIPQPELTLMKDEKTIFYIFCANGCFGTDDSIFVGRKASILPYNELISALMLYMFMPFIPATSLVEAV